MLNICMSSWSAWAPATSVLQKVGSRIVDPLHPAAEALCNIVLPIPRSSPSPFVFLIM